MIITNKIATEYTEDGMRKKFKYSVQKRLRSEIMSWKEP